MRFCVPFFVLFVALAYASLGHAIFADEAYQIDYHHSLLGFPQARNTFFHRSSATSKAALLYTLSERFVLGAVNPRDGAIVWRQSLAQYSQNETTSGFLKAAEGSNTIVSAVGEKIQVWDARDGRIVWGWSSKGSIRGLEIVGPATGAGSVLVLSHEDRSATLVRKFEANTGQLVWGYWDGSGDTPCAVVSTKNSVFYVSIRSALLKGFKIVATELDLITGKQVGQPIVLNSEKEITSKDSILHIGANSGVPFLIWTNKALRVLKANIIGTKQVTSLDVPIDNGEDLERIELQAPRSPLAHPHFLVHYQATGWQCAEVYHFDVTQATFKKAYDLPRLNHKGTFSTASQGSDVYFIRHTTAENVLVSSSKPTVLSQWNSDLTNQNYALNTHDIVHGVSEVLSRGVSTYAVRSALALGSRDWILMRNGEPSWIRSESLSGVVAATFLENAKEETLAEELAAENHRNPFAAYIHRIKRHLKSLRSLPFWVRSLSVQLLGDLSGEKIKPTIQSPHRNSFGFHKLVIVATEHGRLAALDAGEHGKVLWNIKAVTLKPGQTWKVLGIEAENSSALVRAQGGEFLRFSPDTGIILQYQPGEPGELLSALKTSVSAINTAGVNVRIPVKDDGSLGEIPKVNFEEGTVVVTEVSNVLQGWGLGKGSKPILTWQFMPAAGERFESLHIRPFHDPVASIGKVLGDRNVLYKYLNPDILLIVAVGIKMPTVTLYVLDSTSGALMHSITHSDVDRSRPITAAIAENWFTYSLYLDPSVDSRNTTGVNQQKPKGYHLVISELYESSKPNDRGSLGMFLDSSSPIYSMGEDDTFQAPSVVSQSFLMPGPVSFMSVTSTLQGITTRSLLCVLPDLGAIMSVPRSFLDPRRPVGRDPTASEIEEGLFRYSPPLEFEPKWIITHQRDLHSITGILTTPSLLESTSLVLAFGEIDIFGTRISPIGSFDVLGKGFSKLQLLITVFALAVGTTFVAPLVRKKQIDEAWNT